MTPRFVGFTIALMLCLSSSLAHAQRGGRGGGRSGGRAPGGEWSERTHQGFQRQERPGGSRGESEGERGFGGRDRSPETSRGEGAAAGRRNQPQASGAEGAAAASRRNQPQASGAEGAAAANRRSPQYSGAQGAAAGTAAANRNAPTYSGAQGAAAGAAAANRRSPQYSGAQGAAAGAAAANRNAPAYSGAQGVAAGAAAANRNAPVASGAAGAAAGYAAVSNSFDHPGMYGDDWYARHEAAWIPTGWTAGAAWAPATWSTVAEQCGYAGSPAVSYDYGENVTARNGSVLVDGQNVGTTEAFSQQAADLAQAGTDAATSTDEKWLPIGVYALVRNETQHPQLIVQLAINKEGVLRGNYTDEATDHTLPIHGAVDKETKRAAWMVGNNSNSVLEAGLRNLMEGAAPALIHKNGKTDHWLLVRLKQS
jgi:hypothetical protein